MYKVEVDKNKKLVKLKASGFIKVDEVNTILNEYQSVAKQFKPKEAVILVDASEFKPASPEVILIIQKIQADATNHFKKFAAIHTNVISQMQLKRIATETSVDNFIARFKTEEEALMYLFE